MNKGKGNRTTSMGRGPGGVAGADAARLRQQLVQARAEIADLQEDLQEKNNMYMNAIKERDAGVESITNAKESLNRFEARVKQQVDRAMAKEREQHRKAADRLAKLEEDYKASQDALEAANDKNDDLEKRLM